MGALTVTSLGSPQVFHNGVLCPFPLRKALALVLYLAVTGQPHTRAHLIALFWPDADEPHGQVNLRQTLRRLRQTLELDGDSHLLSSGGNLVRLDLGPNGTLDVAALHAATAPHVPPEQRRTALDRYAGVFMADVMLDDAPEFMDWIAAQRAYWDGCYDLIVERELQHSLDDGQADDALALGHAWVAHRPDEENSYRFLATAQATTGDVGGARLTLATAERRWNEVGLALSAETEALQDRLSKLEPSADPKRSLSLPFVGRSNAFSQVRQAYQAAALGHPGVVLMQGEAGIGKSRLVQVFAQWAQLQGCDVSIGHAYELSGRLPYQPLGELLRARLAFEHAPDDLLDDSWLIELQRLAPDLHDRYPDLPLPVDDTAAGTRLVEAIAQLAMALAHRTTVLWVIEDLQWADAATLDALLYLFRRWQDNMTPALLICTIRTEEMVYTPPLETWMAALQQPDKATEVLLTPLSSEQVAHSVTILSANSTSDDICRWLYDETRGNPLYLEQVVQALVERGVMHWQDDSLCLAQDVDVAALTSWLPDTLRGLLLRRVRRLNVVAQRMLAAAAVVGSRFDERIVAQVAGIDENALLEALEITERSLLLRVESGGYSFAHDKVAEALYSDLAPARRRVFHRRALEALEATGNMPAADLARHALAAGVWEQAAAYTQQAALSADQVGAHQDALRFYEQMVQLLTTPPSRQHLWPKFTEAEMVHLYVSLGNRYATLGDTERAYTLYSGVLTQAQAQGAHTLAARMLIEMARLRLDRSHDPAAAQKLLEYALEIAQKHNDIPSLLLVERTLAAAVEDQEDVPLAWKYAHHAVQLARDSRQYMIFAQCLTRLSGVLRLQGKWEAACRSIEESLVIFAGLVHESTPTEDFSSYSSRTPLAWDTFISHMAPLLHPQPTKSSTFARQWGANSLMWMGIDCLHLGDGTAGRAALQMGWQIFTERNERRFHRHYLLHRTLGWIEAGDYERARNETEQTMAESANATDRPIDPTHVLPYCALVDAYHGLFQVSKARIPLEQAMAFAPGYPTWDRLLPATRLCRHYALANEWEAAYAAALQAATLRDALPSPLARFDLTRYYETEALLRGGDRIRAVADVRSLGEHLGANRRFRLIYLRMQALIDRDAHDYASAIAHLVESLALASDMELPGEAWQLWTELASCFACAGDAQQAEAARLQAECGIAALASLISDAALKDSFLQAAFSRLPVHDESIQ